MSRIALERRRTLLAAQAARQRERFADSLAPWQARAYRIDHATLWMRGRVGWIGFAAGAVFGLVAAARPRLLAASARALVSAWPLWRLARWR